MNDDLIIINEYLDLLKNAQKVILNPLMNFFKGKKSRDVRTILKKVLDNATPEERTSFYFLIEANSKGKKRKMIDFDKVGRLPLTKKESINILQDLLEKNIDYSQYSLNDLKLFMWESNIQYYKQYKKYEWNGEIPNIKFTERMNKILISTIDFELVAQKIYEYLEDKKLKQLKLKVSELESSNYTFAAAWCVLNGIYMQKEPRLQSSKDLILDIKTFLNRGETIDSLTRGINSIFDELETDKETASNYIKTIIKNHKNQISNRTL